MPTTWVKAADRSVSAVLDALHAGRATVSPYPEGPRLNLCARAADRTAGLGETLPLPPGMPVELTLQVERGTGTLLRVVSEEGVIFTELIREASQTITATISASVYVRAELYADVSAALVGEELMAQIRANLPHGVGLNGWRWALTNPVYITSA